MSVTMATTTNDLELVRRYAEERSEQAFADIVHRYAGLVYSAALRQTRGDRHRAEEITQEVFITLARKAGGLGKGVVLAGWLLTTTRYTASNLIKMEARRKQHERKAAQQRPEQIPTSAAPSTEAAGEHDWDHVSPILDDAIESMNRGRREALLLRYFEGMSVRQVAERLNISEAATKQRLSRGVEQLRGLLGRRGVTVSAAALAALLATHAAQAAPVGLAAAVAAGAHAVVAAGSAASVSAGAAAATHTLGWKGLVSVMVATTAKTKAIAAGIALIVLLTTATAVMRYSHGSSGNRSPANSGAANAADAGKGTITARYDSNGGAAAGSNSPNAVAYSGIVLAPDGKPVARAEVLLAGNFGMVQVSHMGFQNVPTTKTGPDGRFTLPPQADVKTLVVRCTAGYAEVPVNRFTNGGEMRIEPWGRIEGFAMSGGKPAVGRTIRLTRELEGGEAVFQTMVQHDATARCDDSGHFVFSRVARGRVWVGPEQPAYSDYQSGAGGPFSAMHRPIEVESGATARLELGAGGRSLSGQIAAPAAASDDRLVYTGFLAPAAPGATTRPTRQDWASSGPIAFRVITDARGRFTAENVPPGHYAFNLHAFANYPGAMIAEQAGWVAGEFDVPAAPPAATASAEGHDVPPTEVGSFIPVVPNRLRPGSAAPEFHATTADGNKQLALKDFAGKYLVLMINPGHPSSMWEDPLDLDVLLDRFGGNDKLAFLGIRIGDTQAARPRGERDIPRLPIAYAKLASPAEGVPPEYANAPAPTFLIDPQGKLVTKWASSRGLLDLLHRTLPKATSGSAQGDAAIVNWEHHELSSAGPAYAFGKLPSISATDTGKDAAFAIAAGEIAPESGGLSVLNDGVGATNGDDPKAAFFFAHGSLEGRIRADLGSAKAIERIGTYSWHTKTRCSQVYRIYGAQGSEKDLDLSPRIGTDPAAHGWTPIADVDTRRPSAPVDAGGQDAVNITPASGPSVGSYRYLLFVTFVTETSDVWGHTFFNEIDIDAK
jgi:RNA polymerase sigma factor (sigma-70 family)